MGITIQHIKTSLPEEISQLAQQAKKDGFDFVERLIEEFNSGENRFERQGETCVVVYDEDRLVACGALNQQYEHNEFSNCIGRIRRCYVHPDYRKTGVGRQLLAELERYAGQQFSALCLQTESYDAAHFYRKLNYVHVENNPSYNYFKYLI